MLKINNLTKQYDGFTLNCSLEVKPGCVTGLIGRNGAGKSTTFKAILGVIQKESGQIEIMGKPIEKITSKDKQRIGVALAESGFSSYLTVYDVCLILKSMYKDFSQNKFLQMCKEFGLPTDKRIQTFSTGMKAKLRVLVAITHNADLLILDEPTAGLDVVAREELLDILRNYMEEDEKRSILISSHISSDLESLCDDIYLINEGKIVLHEETDVLLSDYAILKLDENQYKNIDKKYIVKYKQEKFGYRCLTNQKQYYLDNYHDIVIEKGNIDELIVMVHGGK